MSSLRGKKRGEEMVMTTMRVSKRTARTVSYITGVLGLNSEQAFTADEVVWDALQKAYPDIMDKAKGFVQAEQPNESNEQ